jgi:hypothetical protein
MNSLNSLLSPIGLIAAALSVGALGWFFFIQTPLLSKRLGRDRFVPLQMSLMRPLFNTVAVASSVQLVVTLATVHTHLQPLAATVSLSLTLLLVGVVVPRALRAGGRSLAQPLSVEAQHAAGRFIADGGGDASRWWHRAVVVLTLGVVVAQVTWLVSPRHEEAPPPPASHARVKADAATTEGVHHLKDLVSGALAEASQTGAAVGAQVQQAYAAIFAQCTMTGEAHEALHGSLAPMGDMVTSLATAADPAATRAQLERS